MSTTRFKANSGASNVVIGLAAIPGIALLCASITWFERGMHLFGALAAVGCLVVFLVAGAVARQLGRDIEVGPVGVIETKPNGRQTIIRWDEPHRIERKVTVVRKYGLGMARIETIRIVSSERTIAFTATTSAGAKVDLDAHRAIEVILASSPSAVGA